MMKIIVKYRHKAWQLLLSLMAMTSIMLWMSCKDNDNEPIPGTNKQLATPKDLSSKVRGTTVTIAWRGNLETESYEVEHTRLDNSEIESTEVKDTQIIFEELRIETDYTVRVRALAIDPQYNSDWASLSFTTGEENILKATAKELLDVEVVVNWTAGVAVTHFVVYPEDDPSNTKMYEISDSEKLAGEKALTGLDPETTYEVELYNGENLRGSASFTTVPRIYPALEVTFTDITPVSVAISWAENEPVTYFILSPANINGDTKLDALSGNSLLVSNLMPGTEYSVEAFMDNSSRGVSHFTTEMLADCYLTAIPAPTAITIQWTPVDSYITQINYGGNNNYILTKADIEAGEASIINLTPLTEYTFILQTVIGNTTFDRGQVTATTQKPPQTQARYMPEDGSGSIEDYIATCISGDTIVLAAGKTYAWSSNNYAWPTDKSLTIMGANATNRSVISVSVSTFLVLPTSVDSIVFKQMDIVYATGVEAGAYFVNQAAGNACDVKQLVFDGCSISGFGRSILRLQASAAPSNQHIGIFRVNNTIVADCGNQTGQNYAFIQSTAYGLVDNIQLMNSTFNNVSKTTNLITGSGSAQVFQSIAINNCTFYNVVGTGGRHLIDAGNLATNNVAVSIQNSILGKIVDPTADNNRGTRYCTVTTTNTYQTSDWVTTELAPQLDIPNTIPYPGSAADLFVNPDNGDFHIKDASFAGKATAGDPRWR